jgi:3-oxoacyl-[acyl-carrier-protein] synthase II
MKRVVITGIGAVTPLGNDIQTTWKYLKRGRSGIGQISRFDAAASGLSNTIGGEVKHFSPEQYMPKKDMLRLDPFVHYAVAASCMAIEDSGIKLKASESSKTAIIIGSSRGGITRIEKAIEQHILGGKPFSAYLMSSSTVNMASSYVSMKFGIKGPILGISTACASGAQAIGEAARLIRHGEVKIAIAGGTEAPLCKLAVGGYAAAGALSSRNDEPEKASRPFDKKRDGFVISEGSGVLILEELNHALQRDSQIYAELAGYGTSSDAFHQTKPDSTGESIAIETALKDAGVSHNDIDYINAHATSTVLGDRTETQAMRLVFKDRAHTIPISSSKSMLGHMLGGSGAVEASLTALSIMKGTITPTINLEDPDPDCKLNHVAVTTQKDIEIAISNSFGFGGVNAVVVLKKFGDGR